MEKGTQDFSLRKRAREVRGNPCKCVSMESKWEFFKKEGVDFGLKATEMLSKRRTGKVFISFTTWHNDHLNKNLFHEMVRDRKMRGK